MKKTIAGSLLALASVFLIYGCTGGVKTYPNAPFKGVVEDGSKETFLKVADATVWVIPATDRFEIGIAFGPSILQVKQDLVERVGYTHAYPYDEAQSAGVVTGRPTETATGFNAGADLTWKFSRHAGIGGVIRFSRARIETTGGAGDAVSFDAGGLHAGGGLRLIF